MIGRRRVLVSLTVVLLLGLGTGLALALRSSGGPTGGPLTGPLTTAGYRGWLSLRYPSTWSFVHWCSEPMTVPPEIAVLTNARPAPKCSLRQPVAVWPPAQQLGANVVSISLAEGSTRPSHWNAQIAGQPAYVAPRISAEYSSPEVTCPAGVSHQERDLVIGTGLLHAWTTICGPDLAADNAAVDRILASIHFKR